MPECAIHQREHTVGEVVLLEKLGAVDFTFEEGIQAKNRGSAVSRKNRRTGGAERVEGHGKAGTNRIGN